NQLTWKERILITYDIILSLHRIHSENAIHRDLHSGNILYLQVFNQWYISDLGFCGPVDKPLGSVYGNLPYIAPEVIAGKVYKFYYQKEQNNDNVTDLRFNASFNANSNSINSLVRKFSKVHIFEGLPEPRNATEGMVLK